MRSLRCRSWIRGSANCPRWDWYDGRTPKPVVKRLWTPAPKDFPRPTPPPPRDGSKFSYNCWLVGPSGELCCQPTDPPPRRSCVLGPAERLTRKDARMSFAALLGLLFAFDDAADRPVGANHDVGPLRV